MNHEQMGRTRASEVEIWYPHPEEIIAMEVLTERVARRTEARNGF